jgi:Rrf2 family protein
MAYAVHAMLQLARADSSLPVPCSQLAHEGKMPERFLLQILRNLVTRGLLRSTRGVEGGYSLTRPPGQISLLDLFDAFDSPLIPSVPPLEKLPIETCKMLQDSLDTAAAAARKELADVSLADLLEAESVGSV